MFEKVHVETRILENPTIEASLFRLIQKPGIGFARFDCLQSHVLSGGAPPLVCQPAVDIRLPIPGASARARSNPGTGLRKCPRVGAPSPGNDSLNADRRFPENRDHGASSSLCHMRSGLRI